MPSPRELQLERGWVAMLDVDLELAQRMLRLPRAQRPVPPVLCPPVTAEGWDGVPVVLAPAIEPDVGTQPPREAVPDRPAARPRGAYARRARSGNQ